MIEIIPAMDIYEGKCVRLTKGDFHQMKVYHNHPVDLARFFEDQGVKRLHLVDLEGARLRKLTNLNVLQEIASVTHLLIDYGGGIATDADIAKVFEKGARQVTVGSVAIHHPDRFCRWLQLYGPEKIILAADVIDGNIAVSGWSEVSVMTLESFLAEYLQRGVKYVLCTDISKDGMMSGSSIDLYRGLVEKFPSLHFIASGGIREMAEIKALDSLNIYGLVIGKALYEDVINLKELHPYLIQ